MIKNRVYKFRYWDESAKSFSRWDSKLNNLEFFWKDVYKFNFPVMECIGLEDKHGYDIYKFDILYHSKHQTTTLVIWDEKLACFNAIDEAGGSNFYQSIDIPNLVVIGNRFTKPELWKGDYATVDRE